MAIIKSNKNIIEEKLINELQTQKLEFNKKLVS